MYIAPIVSTVFLQQILQDREKEHKNLVCQRLSSAKLEPKFCQEMESHFKNTSRNVLSLAFCLSSQKELKEFFVLLVEKILEGFKQVITLIFSSLPDLRANPEAVFLVMCDPSMYEL
jgi:hypothetical protein